jgi:hypothetical protein
MVTRLQRKLAGKGAAHDDVTLFDVPPELGKLARQPYQRVEWVAQYKIPFTGRDRHAVDRNLDLDFLQCQGTERHRFAENNGLLLGIVGDGNGDLRRQIAARLGNFQRRINQLDCSAHLRQCNLTRQRTIDSETQLALETGVDQLVGTKHVSGRFTVEDSPEDRLVKSELLLNRFGRQPHFPPDLPLAGVAPSGDQAELNAIGLIESEPIEPFGRKVFIALSRSQKTVDYRFFVEYHLSLALVF